jgi:hypothetical protein
LFTHAPGGIDLLNGCFDVNSTGVTTRRGGKEVVGTDGPDVIDCEDYNLPGSKGVRVKGGDGNDIITGSDRADHLSGGKDCDLIHGGEGNDVVDGGQGDDSAAECSGGLFGDEGDDLVKGGKGDDDLNGGGQAGDVCEGGPGNDAPTACASFSQGPP